MKLYTNEKKAEIISVTDAGYGFPLPSWAVDLGLAIDPERHVYAVEETVKEFLADPKGLLSELEVISGDELETYLKDCEFMEEI